MIAETKVNYDLQLLYLLHQYLMAHDLPRTAELLRQDAENPMATCPTLNLFE